MSACGDRLFIISPLLLLCYRLNFTQGYYGYLESFTELVQTSRAESDCKWLNMSYVSWSCNCSRSGFSHIAISGYSGPRHD